MPRPYRVGWTRTAKRELTRLPDKVGTAVVESVYGAPRQSPKGGARLHLDLAGYHAARRGDFRVIYVIDTDQRTVTITAISHRSDAYRRH
jgi:mRNA-degrading endonuclease RelE of RelBE toxin-antitoxin system